MTGLELTLLAERFAVARLAPGDVAPWAWAGKGLVSVTRTDEEVSVVCEEPVVPEGTRAERGWQAIKVAGPIEFTLVGVLASLTVPLAPARVPLFAVSTFDTDYLLVKDHDLTRAMAALASAGHQVSSR